MVATSEVHHQHISMPFLTVCRKPLNPKMLIPLGLEIENEVFTEYDLADNIDYLVGIDPNMNESNILTEASWKLEDLIKSTEIGGKSLTANESHIVWRKIFSRFLSGVIHLLCLNF